METSGVLSTVGIRNYKYRMVHIIATIADRTFECIFSTRGVARCLLFRQILIILNESEIFGHILVDQLLAFSKHINCIVKQAYLCMHLPILFDDAASLNIFPRCSN
jgi:hypothetical protein